MRLRGPEDGFAPRCSLPSSQVSEANLAVERQKVIVELLKSITVTPELLQKYVYKYWQEGILTAFVAQELAVLFRERGLLTEIPCSLKCAGQEMVPAVRPAPPKSVVSRFEQDFERLELLGRGSFGEVWRARNRIDNREYAIKIVPYQFSDDSSHLEHPALREVKTFAAVEHENIVRYHGAWVEVDDVHSADLSSHDASNLAAPVKPISCESAKIESIYTSSDFESSGGIVFEDSPSKDIAATTGLETRPQQIQLLPYQQKSVPKRKATLYVQAELVRGGTLHDWIWRRNNALRNPDISKEEASQWGRQAYDIFHQCLHAVAHLHQKGIVHRDIKPSNIMLSEDCCVKLGDFGLAKTMKVSGLQRPALMNSDIASHPGAVGNTRGVGTPMYASPEQMQQGCYSAKSDVFSLGVVLAELLCPVATQMERAHLLDGIRAWPAPRLPSSLDPGSVTTILRMTDEDPHARPRLNALPELHRLHLPSPRGYHNLASSGQHVGSLDFPEEQMEQRRLCDA